MHLVQAHDLETVKEHYINVIKTHRRLNNTLAGRMASIRRMKDSDRILRTVKCIC